MYNKSKFESKCMKGALCNDEKSDLCNDNNEDIDDVEIMRGSSFQINKEKGCQRLMMQVKAIPRCKREKIRLLESFLKVRILAVKPRMIVQQRYSIQKIRTWTHLPL